MKIFIVEDDNVIREELKNVLISYGYAAEASFEFLNVTEDILKSDSDLVILDINLPYRDGYSVCREIRKNSDIPIVIVTSRNTDMDELMSMNLGADDFITKPYNIPILIARIEAILRRSNKKNDERCFEYKGIKFLPERSVVICNGKEIILTKNENNIMITLFRNKGNIVSRDTLIEELWRTDEFIDDNTLTVNINRLRKKLLDADIKDFILTLRGQGYRI